MKTISTFLSIILILTCSCKKNEDDTGKNHSTTIDFGDISNMFVQQYDTLIVRHVLTYMKSFEIDVDKDNISDFKLVSFNLSGQWTHYGEENGTSISCLHNSASLLSFLETDTLFFNVIYDTTYEHSYVTIHIYDASSCSRIAFDDTIINIWNQNRILPRKYGEKLSTTERFVSDSITITRAENKGWPSVIYQNEHSTIYRSRLYLDHCNSITNEEILFFGIKSGNKLGWIKLLIIDNYKILLLESAIEV